MSNEEKPLGQIAYELPGMFCNWNDLSKDCKALWEKSAQAVIAEWQKRNGDPVGWIDPTGRLVRRSTVKDGGYWAGDPAFVHLTWIPVSAASQPAQLPSVEELAATMCQSDLFSGLWISDYLKEAQAVLDLLKEKKS